MPFSKLTRKVALLQLNMTNVQIGKDLGVDPSLVSHVIAGRRYGGDDAQRVIRHIASLIGAPVDEVFPGWDRRAGGQRRVTDNEPQAA